METTDLTSFEQLMTPKKAAKESGSTSPMDLPPPLPHDRKKLPSNVVSTTPFEHSKDAGDNSKTSPPNQHSFDASSEEQVEGADDDIFLGKVNEEMARALEESAEGAQQLLDALMDLRKVYRKNTQLLVELMQEEKAEAKRLDGIQAELESGLSW